VCRGDTQFDNRIAMCTQCKLFTLVLPEVTTTTCRCSAHDSFSKGLTIASVVAKYPKLMISLTQKGKDLLGFEDDGTPILKNTCRGCKFFTQPQSRVGFWCDYPYDGGLCGPNRHFWEEPDIIEYTTIIFRDCITCANESHCSAGQCCECTAWNFKHWRPKL